ncbi:MAG: DDE-type integrase/transposase/recombinase [Armatimonadota bacterium]|nr:DDE-type integrase/transposase/recombinase [Armatimonadota bacterium]
MSPTSKREYVRAISHRYRTASRLAKQQILTEFCATTGYHRKAAIRVLNKPPDAQPRRRRRPSTYGAQAIAVLAAIWEAAGSPWSVRLKALLPLWLPWAKQRLAISPQVERQVLSISPRTIDRRLHAKKRHLRRRLYGRTKPGTLLKHHIPIKTEHWDVTTPGFAETDLVSHSGNAADGEFAYSLNLTDIHSTWVETRATLGRGQTTVLQALQEMAQALPFSLHGLDSDNGSEFINHHLWRYCQTHGIQFTRGRPYKKDDNAHIEQKNWTHVRKLLGWDRYDSPQAVEAINDLYRNELRLMMNLFQPSVKLIRKVRVGSRLKRVYDRPQTPLDRLLASGGGAPAKIAALQQLRQRLNPFALADEIERKLQQIYRLANHRQSPRLELLRTPPRRASGCMARSPSPPTRRRRPMPAAAGRKAGVSSPPPLPR